MIQRIFVTRIANVITGVVIVGRAWIWGVVLWRIGGELAGVGEGGAVGS